MAVAGRVRGAAVGALRSAPVVSASIAATSGSLRVLTYHTVPDADALEHQLRWLTDRFRPVSSPEVIAALRHGAALPRRAVWVTFDDGDPSVVERGLEVLARHGVRATMFVCPGLIESGEPFWWDVVDAAPLEQLSSLLDEPVASTAEGVERCKLVPDAERRRIVASLPPPPGDGPRQLTAEQIERWLAAGCDLGNHTWDHPCLDRCDDGEQRQQLARADAWLRDRVPDWQPLFAYPNGNFSPVTDEFLAEAGYALALLHDHRLADADSDPMAVSRLHVDAGDPLDRFTSVVSGLQPVLRRAATSLPAPSALRSSARHR